MYCPQCGGRVRTLFGTKCRYCKKVKLENMPWEWHNKDFFYEKAFENWFDLPYEERRRLEETSFIPFLRATEPKFSEEAYQHRLEEEKIENEKEAVEKEKLRKLKEECQKEREEYYRKQRIEWDRRAKYAPKCPICGSPRIKKISAITKAGGVALFGPLGMRKAMKQWHCEDCGSDF